MINFRVLVDLKIIIIAQIAIKSTILFDKWYEKSERNEKDMEKIKKCNFCFFEYFSNMIIEVIINAVAKTPSNAYLENIINQGDTQLIKALTTAIFFF